MAYDPKTVIERYQQMLDLPEGEPTETLCALAGDGSVKHASLGCEPGNCDNCCVGVVELVRQFSEQAVELEDRALSLRDTLGIADRLVKPETPPADDASEAVVVDKRED